MIPKAINFYFDNYQRIEQERTLNTKLLNEKLTEAGFDDQEMHVIQILISQSVRHPVEQEQREHGWMPIESAPRDGRNFLACSEASSVFYAHWANGVVDSADWTDETGYRARHATHWQLLPPPLVSAATRAEGEK